MMHDTPRTVVGAATVQTTLACRHCADVVTAALLRVPGVAGVVADPASGVVTVRAEECFDRADVTDALTAAGHPPAD